MKHGILIVALCGLLLAACGPEGNVAGTGTTAAAPGTTQAAGTDFSSPESVFAAYSNALDSRDEAALKQTILPNQRDSTSAGGGGGGGKGFKIVRREDRSATEVCLFVKFDWPEEPLPHVLVHQDGRWYMDMFKTTSAISRQLGE